MSLEVYVKHGIISASFNRFRSKEDADRKVLSKARKDEENAKKRGYGLISHPIYRAEDEYFLGYKIDRLKFLFPLDGVPMMVYSLVSAMNSGLENVAFVGSEEERVVFDSFCEHFQPKKFVFTLEPDVPSRAGTINSGFHALGEPEGLIYSTTGDLPLMLSIDAVIGDEEATGKVAVFDFNTKQRIRLPWERNFYHRIIGYKGENLEFKEPNLELVDISRCGLFFYDVFYGSRKGGGVGFQTIINLAKTAFKKGYKKRSLSMFAELAMDPAPALDILRDGKRGRPLRIRHDFLQRISDSIFGGPTMLKFEHNDPARLYDIDSFEDWQCYELLLSYAENLHPYQEQLNDFRENVMPKVMEKIPLLKLFREYMRSIFAQFSLGQPCFFDEAQRFPSYITEKSIEEAYTAFRHQ